MAKITASVDAGGLKDLSDLLGAFDENLNIIIRETGVSAFLV